MRDKKNNESDIKETLKRNLKEFAPGFEDDAFVFALLEQVLKKRQAVDEIIEKAAPDWPLDKISIVDRNILRIGLTELLFGDRKEVPPKVAINEAIELAKSFGGENSGKFVNGVLGAVYKEIGEPGREQISQKKKQADPIDVAKLPVEKKGGAIVYAEKDGQTLFALVHDVFGYWTISKGSIEEGENEEEATIREIKEEIGLDIKIEEKLGENEYVNSDQRHRLEDLGQPGVAFQRRIDPHQDAEHRRENGRADRKLQRGRHPFLQEFGHRFAKLVGDAELEAHGIAEIARELQRHRIVKAERLADRGAFGGRGVQRDDLVDRVAGVAEHRKRDDPHRNHDADGLHRPAKRESEHEVLSLLLGLACQPSEMQGPGSATPPGPGSEAVLSCLVAQ